MSGESCEEPAFAFFTIFRLYSVRNRTEADFFQREGISPKRYSEKMDGFSTLCSHAIKRMGSVEKVQFAG
jgi:hypothetical protein